MRPKQQTVSTLKSHGMKPIKHRGQHFLISSAVVKKIIAAADVKPGETVLEIGPGTGVLTRALLEAGARVIAVEKDKNLANLLKSQCRNPNGKSNPPASPRLRRASKSKIQIINQDILTFDESVLKESYKVVANIPYYITGPIIQKFLFSKNPPGEMVLTVQKEVGERIAARPPRANYLSSLAQSFAEVKMMFKVKKENFRPQPKVDSAVIKIIPQTQRRALKELQSSALNIGYINFLRIVFKQPRQTLWNNLRRSKTIPADKLEDVFKKLGLDRNNRGQNLSPKNLETLFDKIIPNR